MIRSAALSDADELYRMAQAFLALTPLKRAGVDRESFVLLIEQLISGGLLLVAGSDGKLVGMIGMLVYPHYFNRHVLTAQEVFWWVEPDHRGSGIAARLLTRAEAWAKQRGAESIQMLAMESLEPEAVGAMYRKRGYEPLERSFVRLN